jgi:hypothetical protein
MILLFSIYQDGENLMSNYYSQDQSNLKTYGYKLLGNGIYTNHRVDLTISIQDDDDSTGITIENYNDSWNFSNLIQAILTSCEKGCDLNLGKITKSEIDALIQTGLFDQYNPTLLNKAIESNFSTKNVNQTYDIVKLAQLDLLVKLIEKGGIKNSPPCFPEFSNGSLLVHWLAYIDSKNASPSTSYSSTPYRDPYTWAKKEYQLGAGEAVLLFSSNSNHITRQLTLNALKSGRRLGSVDPENDFYGYHDLESTYIHEFLCDNSPNKTFEFLDEETVQDFRNFLDLPEDLEELILKKYNSEEGINSNDYGYNKHNYNLTEQALMRFGIPDARLMRDY